MKKFLAMHKVDKTFLKKGLSKPWFTTFDKINDDNLWSKISHIKNSILHKNAENNRIVRNRPVNLDDYHIIEIDISAILKNIMDQQQKTH